MQGDERMTQELREKKICFSLLLARKRFLGRNLFIGQKGPQTKGILVLPFILQRRTQKHSKKGT
jgi:hypothetical protein